MGQFIDEVVKNNALQREYLTERQRKQAEKELKQAEKERKQAERLDEARYKQTLQIDKKEAQRALVRRIEQEFDSYGSSRYNTLNNRISRDEIVGEIINSNELIQLEVTHDDIQILRIELQQKYFAVLKQQYNIQKNIEKSEIQLLPEEEEEEEEESSKQTEKKKKNHIFFYIIYVVFVSVCAFIHELYKPHTLPGNRRRRRY